MISASYAGGLAMTAQVGREDVPAQAQRWNHRQKYLPAPAESMQQHERRPVGGTFGVVQANFAGVKGVLDKAWMVFAHNLLAHNTHRLAASAS
jgi:hypothetical protein